MSHNLKRFNFKEIKDVFNNEIKPKIVFKSSLSVFKKNFQNYKVLGVALEEQVIKDLQVIHCLQQKQILKIIKNLISKENMIRFF